METKLYTQEEMEKIKEKDKNFVWFKCKEKELYANEIDCLELEKFDELEE